MFERTSTASHQTVEFLKKTSLQQEVDQIQASVEAGVTEIDLTPFVFLVFFKASGPAQAAESKAAETMRRTTFFDIFPELDNPEEFEKLRIRTVWSSDGVLAKVKKGSESATVSVFIDWSQLAVWGNLIHDQIRFKTGIKELPVQMTGESVADIFARIIAQL